MTDSDIKIKRRIAHLKKVLAKCQKMPWTAEKIKERIAYEEKQLSLPRKERCQYILDHWEEMN